MHLQMLRDFISSVEWFVSEIISFCQVVSDFALTEELIVGAAAYISGLSWVYHRMVS